MVRVISIDEELKTANFKCDACGTEQNDVDVTAMEHPIVDGSPDEHLLQIACSNGECNVITFYPDEGGELSKKLHEVHNAV